MRSTWEFVAVAADLMAAAAVAVWLAALWLVIRSPKFIRKWLWGLLCCFGFSYSWSVAADAVHQFAIPVGAVYVLWFWRSGPSPTPEELAKAAKRLANRPPPVAAPWRIMILRWAYAVAAIASAAVGVLVVSGGWFPGGWTKFMVETTPSGPGAHAFSPFAALAFGVGVGLIMAAALVGVLVWLAIRPYWWGKVLCVWPGVAWSSVGVGMSELAGLNPRSTFFLVAGLTMLVVAGVHQFVDPRFSGSYLRAS